jgi:hypothetical protein
VKRLSDQTLYEILEVSPEAPREEIARAYERSRSLYGPGSLATYTLMAPDEAALLQSRIDEAKAVLLDDDGVRARYDERIGVRPRSAPEATPSPAPSPTPPAVEAAPPWPPPVSSTETVLAPAPAVIEEPERPPPSSPPATTPAPVLTPAPAMAPIPSPAPARVAAEATAPPDDRPVSPGLPAPSEPVRPAGEAVEPVARPAAVVPILLRNELPAPRDLLVPEGAAWTGAMLKQVREARGMTSAQISERTKVTRYHVENIEADRFQKLPAPVYLRGILMSLARELRLDGQKVARSYLDRMAAEVAAAHKR